MLKLASTLLLSSACLLAADYSGTWAADIQKSNFGRTPYASYVMKLEQTAPNTFRVTVDSVNLDGEASLEQFTRIYDGKEHRIYDDGKDHPGMSKGASEICTQVDPVTRHILQKTDGKVTSELDSTISADGKTMITRRTVPTPEGGKREVQVFVFERQ